ncbi:prolyl oligopeptidase family serine peptidase [Neobacillus sp. 3P2-tot-E-2]|uniref:prolyl oligopeptidase family serine peptidase n=1 Tax=Neobacillus sp. 3P2-tot-E-2 TaxID=3132212 RepID=UPI00399F044E
MINRSTEMVGFIEEVVELAGKMKRLLFLVFVMAVTFSFGLSVSAKEKEGAYRTVIEVQDFGPVITKVIVELGQPVPQGAVIEDTFNVHVEKTDPRVAEGGWGAHVEGNRTVTNAYVSDKDGNAIDQGRGKYAVLEMEIGPNDLLGSTVNYDFASGHNDWVDYDYTITQVKDIVAHSGKGGTISDLVIETFAGETRVLVDDFTTGDATYGDITLSYADFKPAKDKGKNPLIIWLHGGGEGGSDPTIAIGANKAVAFASDEAQEIYGGAYVLAPQAPTYWMQSENSFADGTSIYSNALISLIKDYVANNPDIDPNKIYIGGASNGGYMTMLLIRDNPGYFAAAFPVCEGLFHTRVTDEDIVNMIQTPIWFVHSKNDSVLNPNFTSIPAYNRMIAAGANNVYLSLFEDVRDTSGLYTNADGQPHQYDGHWSWIYVFNNGPSQIIDGVDTTIMEWMAAQKN